MRPILFTIGLLAGAWLQPAAAQSFALDAKAGLQWLDAQGRVQASLPLRAKRWDQRVLPDGAHVALLLESDRAELVLVRGAGTSLTVTARQPAPALEVERICLHRDAQGLLHAFLLGHDGISQQWLLSGPRMRPERDLSTPFAPGDCAASDAAGRLLVAEPGVGLWSYAADPEDGRRSLLQHASQLDEKALQTLLRTSLASLPAAAAPLPQVPAAAQTDPVRNAGDAADDPAIWRHPTKPGQSLVLGTDKKRGLAVYDLKGRERQFLAVGRINNVDLRQGLRYGGAPLDLAVATQRDEAGLVLFEIRPDGRVRELARLPTGLADIYGLCVGRNAQGQLDIFPNDKDGRVQQLRLLRAGTGWRTETVRSLKLESQPEGCVVDEARQQLFVGEEKRGVWRLPLGGTEPWTPVLAVAVGGPLVADVEGLAIFGGNAALAQRFLVVSSQGNDSYLLYDADAPHTFRGAFRIGIDAVRGIDGVSETDGLELSAANFGGPFRDGLLVVQDGHKRLPHGTQNFKLVAWSEVIKALRLMP